jgi:hypothetical protein
MPTLWIHRAQASDILVDFDTTIDAYDFGLNFMERIEVIREEDESTVTATFMETLRNTIEGKQTGFIHGPCVHIIMTPTGTKLDPNWSQIGFVSLKQNDAIILGEYDEPAGFIPYEFLRIWTKETRSKEELDAELDAYMEPWRAITASAELSMRVMTIE